MPGDGERAGIAEPGLVGTFRNEESAVTTKAMYWLSKLPARPRPSRRRVRENLLGWLFIAPNMIWVAVFTLYPLYDSLRLSFREWNPIGVDKYVGIANYRELAHDWVFILSYKNALYYAALTISMGLIWAIATSLAVQNVRWRAFFRAVFFLPTVTSSVAIAVFWGWMYQPDSGLVNGMLRGLGISGPNWLGNTTWAMPAVSLVVVWMNTGYWMVIFLAGLLDIPQVYVEAAKVDGASSWQVFRHIVLPMLTPTIFYYLTNALITVWLMFDLVYVMTGGGPANATLLPALHLYNTAWRQFNMGYASAMAWVMALIVLAVTGLHFGLARRWVTYER
jgi:multiple sugar transport system permease protein